MTQFRYAEVFAGVGGLSLGVQRAGFECAWHAELAAFPRRVLEYRWPDTPLYGDVTELDGRQLVADHGSIDLLAGGSPCQDLSTAGKRAGLAGARSGLFHHQMRLWDETHADLCLWENVCGALSSNRGRDFAAVLSAFVGAPVVVPADGWRNAGVAAGPTGIAAWRVLDAQFFGVPQRRRRVFVIGTRSGRVDPAEVLSLAESVCGHSPKSSTARENTADTLTTRANQTSGFVGDAVLGFDVDARHGGRVGDVVSPLLASDAQPSGRVNGVLSFDAYNQRLGGVMHSLRTDIQGGNFGGVIAFDLAQITHPANKSIVAPGRPAPTLAESGATHVCVTGDITHALMSEGADAGEDGSGRGTPIVARMSSFGDYRIDETTSAIKARDYKDATDLVVGTVTTRTSQSCGVQDASSGHFPLDAGVPRRLTPRECERLMGWPDDWTNVPDEHARPASDSVRYKACGNGVVSNCVQWIAERLYAQLTTPNGVSHG